MEQYDVNEQGVLVEYMPEDFEEDMYAVVPEGVKVISRDAFWCLGHLKSVTLPNTVIEIEEEAFFECEQLETINIPDSVKNIGDGAFYLCRKLKNIEVPKETFVGDAAFAHCYCLANSEGFIIVNDVLYGYVGQNEELTIPQNVIRISGRAFEGRQSIIKVNLPNGLLSIGEDAFCNCTNLEQVNFPDSLTEIGDGAFYRTKIKL